MSLLPHVASAGASAAPATGEDDDGDGAYDGNDDDDDDDDDDGGVDADGCGDDVTGSVSCFFSFASTLEQFTKWILIGMLRLS